MTFLEAVNRLFVTNGFIREDTDPITSFSQVQHNASIGIAKVAIQDELTDLVSRKMLGYEREDGTITFDGSRVYTLPEDFRSFAKDAAYFKTSDNDYVYQYPGGLAQLEFDDPLYQTTSSGQATHWYWDSNSSKRVGFWPIPSSGDSVTYRYEKSVMVTGQGNALPFHTDEEAFAFCTMAARRFKFLYETPNEARDVQAILENDTSYRTARGTLYRLMRGQHDVGYYGHKYC